jgi:hypothetical protein
MGFAVLIAKVKDYDSDRNKVIQKSLVISCLLIFVYHPLY